MPRYSCLPTWPLILFGIVDPAIMIIAYITGLRDPETFYTTQSPHPTLTYPPQAESLTLQTLNMILIIAFMALLSCWQTRNPTVTKGYLLAVALGDWGHIHAVYRGVGAEYFWALGKWNAMTWGNVGTSVVLNVGRWMTLMGMFGRIGGDERWKKE